MAMAVRIRTSAETGGRVVLVFFVCFISSFIISHSYWEGVVQAAPNSVLESALELDHSNSNPNTEPENPNQNDRAQNGSAQNDSACEHHLVPFHFSSVDHQQQKQNHDSTSSSSSTSWEDDITLAVHHNGNPAICGTAPFSLRLLRSALVAMTACASESESEDDLSKYQVESLLTEFFASALQQGDGGADCGVVVASDAAVDSAADTASGDTTGTLNGITSGLLSFCDMGPEKTVVQNDFDDLIHVPSSDTLPCRWFTREGLRITSLAQMGDLLQEQTRANNNCTTSTTNNNGDAAAPESQTCAAQNMLHLYAAPAGRVFMFAPSFVGETFTINHVKDADEKIITLEVLSLEPRVFDIVNFFNEQESNELVEKALKETSETYRFHRSTTGTSGASVFNKRTSENAWDTHGATALKVKRYVCLVRVEVF